MITKTTTSPCILSANPLPNPLPDETTFNARYWAAQDPKIQANLVNGVFESLSQADATVLAETGIVIDVQTMCWGWSPFLMNSLRLMEGYVWSPSALQPAPTVAPGTMFPGQVPYNPNNPPAGAISNSLNLADYPAAIAPPAPPPTPSFIDLVGAATGTMYNERPVYNSAPSTDNSAIQANGMFWNSRGEFQKILIMTPFGAQIFWVLVQATT